MSTRWKEGEQGAAGRVRATQEQIRLRVQQIYVYLRDGLRAQQIYQLCAKQRELEIAARVKAKQGGQEGPPVVWGDDPLPSVRQLNTYIQSAKKLIAVEGRELSKQAEYVLGSQYARILDVYSRALADKKYHAALRAIEQISRLFGLEGAIKLQILPPQEGDDSAKQTPRRVSELTPESAFSALQQLMTTALARAQAQGKLQGVQVEQLLLGQPVKVVEPSTNGDKR